MRSRRHPLLALALILALAGLQPLGLARGYLCDCTESLRWVMSARCASDCHPGRAHHACGGGDHQQGADGEDAHDHHLLRVPLEAAGALKDAPELLPPPVAEPPSPQRQSFAAATLAARPRASGAGPPAALVVARSVVRQV